MRLVIKGLQRFFVLFLIAFSGSSLFASEPASNTDTTAKKGFSAGAFIIDHVTDKYDWHLFGDHEHPVSIPLPVILYSSSAGFDIFLSSKFEHGKVEVNGYALDHGHIARADNAPFYDFSITKNVAALLLTCAILLLVFLAVAKAYRKREGMAPKGIQSFVEPLILFVRDDIARTSIGDKHHKKFLPFLLTIFFFIWISNFIGLIPTFPGVMGSVSVTLALATMVLLITLVIGNKHYWTHILWMPGVPALVKILLLTPIELIGVFQRPLVLLIRLFANIAAGHIVILSFICLIFVFGSSSAAGGWGFTPVSMAFAIFMYSMELLVAFLQAYVFTLLTAMYIGSCVEEPHHAEHH